MSNSESSNGFHFSNDLPNKFRSEYITSKFVTRNESNYALRDSVKKFFVPSPRTNYMKNSFSYSGETLWSSLPCNHGNQVYKWNVVVS